MLETLLPGRRKHREPEPQGELFTIGAIRVRATDLNHVIRLQGNPHNLETALEHGIKPLTFKEITDQIDPRWVHNAILFDTSPDPGSVGNHFRIVESETGEPQLQLCGTFGNYDIKGVNPFTPPKVYPMFTGVTIQPYKVGGKMATLDEAIRAYEIYANPCPDPRDVRPKAERILLSDMNGKLVKIKDHPISQKQLKSNLPEHEQTALELISIL